MRSSISSGRSLIRISRRPPQHLRERQPRISPVPHERLGPARLTDQGFSRLYKIPYRAVKLPRVSAAFGRFCLRRGADLPQVDHRAETPGALIGQPPRRRRDRPAAGRLCTDEPRKTRRGCSAIRRKSMAVGCACIGSLRTKLKLGSRGSQERDGKTPCRAMHWVSVASVAVKIGFAVGRAKVLLPSPPYVVPSTAKSAWF